MPRVLHIEDDPRNRLLVRKLLTADGLEVIDAPDGLEGVRLALAQRPDLILVDINIPGLDGYEVTLRLRNEAGLRGAPIVGYLRMLIDGELGDVQTPQKKALRAMDDCVRRLRASLDNLVDVTGLETGKMRFFNREYDFLDTVRRAIAQHADGMAERRI